MKPLNRIINAALIISILPSTVLFQHNRANGPNGYDLGKIKCAARDSTYSDVKNGVIKLYGDASISGGFIKVNADYIELHRRDSTVLAQGNVIAYDMTGKVIKKAPSATFHLK